MPELKTNVLYYGDNLEILRDYIPDGSVDLIYLDPPFNSQQQYNVLFKEPTGQGSTAQIRAFTDTWHWDMAAEKTYQDIIVDTPMKVSKAVEALRNFIGANDVMAYLVMMTLRLVELHRALKPTGSLYLHCDPTASHYLKVILDTIFGPRNFRNELSWIRSNPKSLSTTNFPNSRDIILRYSKSDHCTFNKVFSEHDPNYVDKAYRYTDASGKRYRLLPLLNPNDNRPNLTYEFLGVTRVWRWSRERMAKAYDDGLVVQLKPGAVPQYKLYLEDSKGKTVTNDWNDIPQAAGNEALGYPTQKPLALLERVISASSNEGDVVLDPFCGCGTAIIAAQKLGRRWIGIDITHLAITVMRRRLEDSFPGIKYEVIGEPKDLEGAKALARQDRYQFQWWALSLVNALPQGGERKKGADEGIDGVISFVDDRKGKARRAIVQVKSGHVGVRDIREMKAVIGDENLGLFITLAPPTEPMRVEATTAGLHSSILWERDFPRMQIFTVAELLEGKQPELPGKVSGFARAPRVRRRTAQITLQFLSAESGAKLGEDE